MNKDPRDLPKNLAVDSPSPFLTELPNRPPRNEGRGGIFGALSGVLLFILFPALIAIILTAFVIQSYQVDGESMETTLQNHDRLIVDKLPRTWSRVTHHQYVPNRGDIVIFNQTGLPDSFFQKQLIKRVIGLPGDRVEIKDGRITVYNASHQQGFNPDSSGRYHISVPVTSGNINVVLESNEIYVCGDNRDNSEDSRYFGPVKTNAIVGKLVLRIYPFNKTEAF